MSRIRSNREAGVLALYAGRSEQEAMEAAGLVYSPANGRRFRNSPDVRARLKELFEADRPYFVLDALRARREREALAYSRIGDYFEDELGDLTGRPTGKVRFKGFGKLTDQQIAAIASIKPTKLGYEIKLHDKDASLRAIEVRVDPIQTQPADGDDLPMLPDQVATWAEVPQAGVRPN